MVLSLAAQAQPPWMQGPPGGRPASSMGWERGPAAHQDIAVIHQLFDTHERIQRRVELLSNGIRATTTSSDPQVAALLQQHVQQMYRRLAERRPFPMIRHVPTLPALFNQADRYQRHFQPLDKGVQVEETTQDQTLVATLHEHAREISQFVKEGRSALHP
jgi:hypothetical protein